jgi:hypothetical protein
MPIISSLYRQLYGHLLTFGLIAAVLSSIPTARAASFYLDKRSRPVILAGYSIDLKKQNTAPLVDLSEMLSFLKVELEHMFDAKVDYLSEVMLNQRLDSDPDTLAKREPEHIKKLLAKRYTHVIVAETGNITGVLSIHLGKLSKGGQNEDAFKVEWEAVTLEQTLPSTHTHSDLENVRRGILADFAKFREPTAPKTVHIECIRSRNPITGDMSKELRLEKALVPEVTRHLIRLYQRMKDQGYWPIVNEKTYTFEYSKNNDMTCRPAAPTVRNVTIRFVDFTVGGEVGVRPSGIGGIGLDSVNLQIEFNREWPPPCSGSIPISHPFDPVKYNHQDDLFDEFVQQTLYPQYERRWIENVKDHCQEDR